MRMLVWNLWGYATPPTPLQPRMSVPTENRYQGRTLVSKTRSTGFESLFSPPGRHLSALQPWSWDEAFRLLKESQGGS